MLGEKIRGSLLLIGGSEDKDGHREILKRYSELVSEKNSYLVILTSATTEPESVGLDYQHIFKDLGIDSVKVLNIDNREKASNKENCKLIENASGIFFTGGDQLRITSIFGGSRISESLKKVYEAGAIVAGTSAGASVVSDIMIVGGHGDDSPQLDSVNLASGLGLLEEVIIDQHFAQRGRINRLMMAIAYNPYILGIGIDEDTAIEISPDGFFVVRGSNTVTVVDGRSITYSNISEIKNKQPLALLDVKVHILPANYKYSLRNRGIILPQ